MKVEELRKFLRFSTGSSAMTAKKINITFNSMSGFARRIIAHTCSCTIEVPTLYNSYADFEKEVNAILLDSEYTWEMNAL